MKLPESLIKITRYLHTHDAKAIVVGGAVRDMLLGLPVKDYDVEVYGLHNLKQLEEILSVFGSVNHVGKSFGVMKLKVENEEYDFSFPRTEQKVSRGHKGFDVEVDGALSFTEAARRRDFTINALGYDIQTGEVLDPFGGLQDIQYKVLRHIDDNTFVEDPLRIYRAVQFAARFGLKVAKETARLCKQMIANDLLDELPKERIYIEWEKLLLKSSRPSIGFELMREWGITERYFPELHALVGVPQDPKYHPEGDVWVHTMFSIDAMASILGSEEFGMRNEEWSKKRKLKLLFAELCHDFGKPVTTTIELEGGENIQCKEFQCNQSISEEIQTKIPYSIRALGHETAGIEPTRCFMYRLSREHDFIKSILPLVEHHLKPSQFYRQQAKAGAIRRLAMKVNIEELVLVARADFLGRTTKEAVLGEYKAGDWLLEKAEALQVKQKPLEPFVTGKDLISLGLTPSCQFKKILDEVYDLQLDGELSSREEALQYIQRRYCA